MLMFTLAMPSNNSWNGRWSGQDRPYAIVRREPRDRAFVDKILAEGSFHYNFGDGWTARVSVERIDSSKAAGVRKKSRGFCSYDWMVDDILRLGRIRTLAEREAPAPVSEARP